MILKKYLIILAALMLFAMPTLTSARDLSGNIVAWYDCRSNDGTGSYNSTASGWADLSGKGNNLTFNKTGDTYWFTAGGGQGLRIAGREDNVTYLPQAVVDAVNGTEFTLEFFVANMNNVNNEYMSIIGHPREDFAVYRIKNAKKVYIKTPDTKTFINRPFRQTDYNDIQSGFGVSGHHCVITVNTSTNELKWYLEGNLIAESGYSKKNSVKSLQLLSESGTSLLYKQIKVFDVALTAEEAENEATAYKNGTF